MNNLGDIFEKKLNQMGIKRQVEAALICEAFDKAILEVFGENGQKNVRAISFKNGTLKVGVASSAWAQEVGACCISLVGRKMKIRYELKRFIDDDWAELIKNILG